DVRRTGMVILASARWRDQVLSFSREHLRALWLWQRSQMLAAKRRSLPQRQLVQVLHARLLRAAYGLRRGDDGACGTCLVIERVLCDRIAGDRHVLEVVELRRPAMMTCGIHAHRLKAAQCRESALDAIACIEPLAVGGRTTATQARQ